MDIRSRAGQTWGKYANTIHTLNIAQELVGYKEGGDIKFTATIPQNRFPHKNRCLVMIDSFSFRLNKPLAGIVALSPGDYVKTYETIMAEPTIAVSLDGLGVMNSYDTLNRQNDIVGVVDLYINKATGIRQAACVHSVKNGGDIFSKGVLTQSPFGKSLGIRILDAHTLKTLKQHKESNFPLTVQVLGVPTHRGGGIKVDVSLV